MIKKSSPLLLGLLILLTSCSSDIKDPENQELGIDINGKLKICPDKPYCISSQDPNPKNFQEPIFYPISNISVAMEETINILDQYENFEYETVNVSRGYIRANHISKIWGLKDEVELFFDKTNNQIDFRSSLVNGFFDFGSNKARIKYLKQKLEN